MSSASRDRPVPLFVGDHPALDFLNSTATPAGERLAWLADGGDLVDWMVRARLIDATTAGRFADAKYRAALDGVAAQARTLREWLRAFATRRCGTPLDVAALDELAPLNRLLAHDD